MADEHSSVTKGERGVPADVPAAMAELIAHGGEVEIVTLKGHLWVEARLEELLRVRLGVPEGALPRLSFAQLAGVALCGVTSREVRDAVILVNQIRNAFAHEFTPPGQSQRMRRLVELTEEGPWPEDRRKQLFVYSQALAHLAGVVRGLAEGMKQAPQRQGTSGAVGAQQRDGAHERRPR